MVQSRCPHCKAETEQRLVRQAGGLAMLWCRRCYQVWPSEWSFDTPFQEPDIHADLTLNDEILDNDHACLATMLRHMNECKSAKGQRLEYCKQFEKRIGEHFRREEDILKQIHYPQLSSHRRRHGRYFAKIHEQVLAFGGADTAQASQIIASLQACLIDLLLDDMHYKNHLAAAAEGLVDHLPPSPHTSPFA